MNLVDTSGWVEFFFGGPNAAYFTRAIEEFDETVTHYEVAIEKGVKGNRGEGGAL